MTVIEDESMFSEFLNGGTVHQTKPVKIFPHGCIVDFAEVHELIDLTNKDEYLLFFSLAELERREHE